VLTANNRILRRAPVFAALDPGLLDDLSRAGATRVLARGDALWRTGDPATHFTVIASGLMKIVRPHPDGTDTIVGIFGPGESIGDTAVLERSRYPADALAASETAEVLHVDATPLLEAMATDPAIARSMNRALIEHTRALQSKIAVMSAGSVPRRLGTLLLYLAERFGDELPDGTLVIPVLLSRAELASLVGARVETTIRIVSGWQKSGLLRTSAEGFSLPDPERIRELVQSGD
jgi:CRP/FNR family transcriptional regulator, nitrogen oxide reductase regulator